MNTQIDVQAVQFAAEKPFFRRKKLVLAMSGMMLASTATLPVVAQEQEGKEGTAVELQEIIVTGTLIRGIEPTGSQVIGIDREKIIESGAVTATELLGTLPQASNLFNQRTSLDPRALSQNQINRPNLRNLPGFSTSTGAATLVLIDGHRVTGMGTGLSAVDPDILPPAVIERVEVITDGGSSLYGADAIGGVVNFITRSDFDGVRVDAGYTTGDDYGSYETNITGGTAWEGGSGYVSLSYSERDSILGGDRSWADSGLWSEAGVSPTGRECRDPVGGADTYTYTDFGFLPFGIWFQTGSTSTGEPCDIGAEGSLLPAEERGSLYFGLNQELNDNVSLQLKGFYSERDTSFESYPLGDTLALGEPPITNTPGQPGNLGDTIEVLNVGFSYGPHPAYFDRDAEASYEVYGLTPELTVDMDNGWQLRSLMHFSHSDNFRLEPDANRDLLIAGVNNGTVDPFNIASTSSAIMSDILNWELGDEAEQELFLARMIADGPVMGLPAGDLRLAVGFEYQDQSAKRRLASTVIGGLGGEPFPEEKRDVKAFFAEFNVPIVSGAPGVESLVLSASARYDDYSDFGTTTNPHLGLTWEPVDWVSINANWGESFNAPTLMDTLAARNSQIFYNANTAGLIAAVAADAGVDVSGRPDVMQVRGANDSLDPQTAETMAFGFQMSPPAVEGLNISANYYEIEFEDILGFFNPTTVQSARAFIDKFIFNPTQQDLEDFAMLGVNGEEAIAGVNPANVAALIDLRTTNAQEATLKGIDFTINYRHDTDLGIFSYGIAGNHQTEFDLSATGGEPVDQLEFGTPDTLMTGTLGWQRGSLRSALTVRHTVGFDVDDAALDSEGNPLQTSVGSFTVADLFVSYDVQGSGLLSDLSLRLNVGNIFDEDPPLYRRNEQPAYSGFTLGRTFTLGFTKNFY